MAVALRLLVLCWVSGPGRSQTSPAWFQNITTNLFNTSGDILLGGLFPINELTSNLTQRVEPDDISCRKLNTYGLGLALVMKFTVDEINANQVLLPGIKLGYELFDTCKQSAVIVKPTLLFLTEGSTRELAVMCNYTDYVTRVVAVIGPYTSEMVTTIGKLLGFFLMPQISYGATSDKFSDKRLYPSFLRTVPSDKWQAEAIVHLLNAFKWNWVAVVGSEDEYGREGQRQFSTQAAGTICVAYEALIPIYSDPEPAVREILDRIAETSVGVVVLFSLSNSAKVFFTEVIRRNLTGVWVASSAWALSTAVASLPNINTVGTILAFTDRTHKVELLTNYTEILFSKLSEQRAKQPSPGPDTPPHINNPCPECWNLSLDNMSVVTAPLLQRTAFSVYTAIYSAAQGLHNLLGCNATGCLKRAQSKIYPWQLLEVLKNVSLDLHGSHFEFDSSGNPSIGYDILQWIFRENGVEFKDVGIFFKTLTINKTIIKWYTDDSKVPTSTCSANCKTGQVRRVKGFHSCCYDCIDCLEGHFQKSEEDIQCTACPRGQWSVIQSTNCTYPTFDYLGWDEPESQGLLVAVLAVLGVQGAVGVLFLRHMGTPLVKASGGALGGLALVSLMGGCLSLLLFLGQPGDMVCRLQLPLNSIFHTVTLSAILAFSLQILYVTEFPQVAASHLDVMRGYGAWLVVLVCCGVQAGLCGWFIQEGSSLTQYLDEMKVDFVRMFLRCPVTPILGLGLMQGFNGVLALISFMFTFMAVKPAREYNLARDITFSTLIYCVAWVVFIPIYTGLTDKKRSIVHVLISLLSNLGLVAAYFFPKCHLLLKKPDLNKAEHFRTFLEGAPPTPLEEEPSQGQAPQDQTTSVS